MEYSTFGRHVAMDAWGVDFDLLNDAPLLEKHMRAAAKKCGATVLSSQSKFLNRRERRCSFSCRKAIYRFILIRRKDLPHWIVTLVAMTWIL